MELVFLLPHMFVRTAIMLLLLNAKNLELPLSGVLQFHNVCNKFCKTGQLIKKLKYETSRCKDTQTRADKCRKLGDLTALLLTSYKVSCSRVNNTISVRNVIILSSLRK